jgi:hypothetical protein
MEVLFVDFYLKDSENLLVLFIVAADDGGRAPLLVLLLEGVLRLLQLIAAKVGVNLQFISFVHCGAVN